MSNSTPATPKTERLQPKALYEVIAAHVRQRILSHELKPGESVNEMDFVNSYGVSRTPVREALKVLNHEGLLTLVNRRGMVVTQLEPHERQEALHWYRLLCTHPAHQQQISPTPRSRPSMLQRLLGLVECQLRLAYGPSFEEEMQRLGLPCPRSWSSGWSPPADESHRLETTSKATAANRPG